MQDGGFKVKLTKLIIQDDFAKWNRTTRHVLKAHQLESIVTGAERKPAEPPEAMSRWERRDAKAASLTATALGDQVAKLVLTCETSRAIWRILSARFERSSKQRLDSLIEQLYQAQKDDSEDMATHIATLQKLFMDMSIELRRHSLDELSEIMFVSKIPAIGSRGLRNNGAYDRRSEAPKNLGCFSRKRPGD